MKWEIVLGKFAWSLKYVYVVSIGLFLHLNIDAYAYVFVKMTNILLIPNENVKRLDSGRMESYT